MVAPRERSPSFTIFCASVSAAFHPSFVSAMFPVSAHSELFEKPEIVFIEMPDVVDPVPDHRGTFDPHPERESGVFRRINFAVFEHPGQNHSAAENLAPARLRACFA